MEKKKGASAAWLRLCREKGESCFVGRKVTGEKHRGGDMLVIAVDSGICHASSPMTFPHFSSAFVFRDRARCSVSRNDTVTDSFNIVFTSLCLSLFRLPLFLSFSFPPGPSAGILDHWWGNCNRSTPAFLLAGCLLTLLIQKHWNVSSHGSSAVISRWLNINALLIRSRRVCVLSNGCKTGCLCLWKWNLLPLIWSTYSWTFCFFIRVHKAAWAFRNPFMVNE